MKHLKHLFTALLLLCCIGTTKAHDFEVDGIYYNITDATNKTVAVTYYGGSFNYVTNEYTGCVVIPENVNYNSTTYSVTSIGNYAFEGCYNLKSIEIPNSVTSIGSDAFYGCSGLTSIVIGNSVTSIGYRAFEGTAWYNNQPDGVVYADNVLYKYKGTMPSYTSVVVKEGTLGIAEYAFEHCSGLTSITIPNSVTSIGGSAFSYCYGLTSIKIPNSVTSIGGSAFSYCYGLTSVTIPNSVTSIGSDAFNRCSGLKSIEIPNSLTRIGDGAFSDCSGLTSIVVEVSNKKYDSRENCNAIIETESNTLIAGCMSTIIPNSVTSIGWNAFENCYNLKSIEIPNSVTSIGGSAFSYCSGLTSIEIPNSVTSIGWNTFYYCSGLTSVTIGNGVTSIGEGAFRDCSDLTSVVIGNSVTSIGDHAFSYCSRLTSIEIPNSVTSIEYGAFEYCLGLTSITIPNSVTSIGNYAFYGCSGLTSVTIGNGVTSIENYAFEDCKNLTDVYCLATDVPSTSSSAFDNSYPENITLHVPAEAINSYKTTSPWSSFGNIVALKEEIVETPKCVTPVIDYNNGKLTLECDTENAEIVTKITSNDINSFYGNTIELTVTYNISVYATASGYENSDTINATLCWIECDCNADDNTGIIDIPAKAVLVTSNGGVLSISCQLDGAEVAVYTTDGVLIGTTTIDNGVATVATDLSKGTVAIVKIADKSIKVIIN